MYGRWDRRPDRVMLKSIEARLQRKWDELTASSIGQIVYSKWLEQRPKQGYGHTLLSSSSMQPETRDQLCEEYDRKGNTFQDASQAWRHRQPGVAAYVTK